MEVRKMITEKYKLHRVHNHFLIDRDITPTQNNQIFEEMLELEREFGAMMRFQRDLDGRIP